MYLKKVFLDVHKGNRGDVIAHGKMSMDKMPQYEKQAISDNFKS